MKMINLEKLNEPEFDELFSMIADLKDFLDEDANLNDKDWSNNLNEVLDFQDPEGTFKLLNLKSIPTEARIDFIHMPTYICTAILMKAYMSDSSAFALKEKSALSEGLKASCARNLRGHGFDAFKSQIEVLNLFMKAGLREFIDLHPDLCPEFTAMINDIISKFKDKESQGDFLGPWKESYEDEIIAVNKYFSQRKVFVYGTLMSGEANNSYLKNSTFLGKAYIEGYNMYDVGWYPAIVLGDSLIIGELYTVPLVDMPSIDALEGEGSLYAKKCETVTGADGETTLALVYVYLGDVSNLKRIPAWKKDYLWYVAYGSNMLREGFMRYINGGSVGNSRPRSACNDLTPPVAVKTFEIPYDMYFGNNSPSWEYMGVSFLDMTKKGKALGVAYLITREQFDHVAYEENGRPLREDGDWYEHIVDLGTMDGFEVKTITNRNLRQPNEPCQDYRDILVSGIKENWPEMTDEEIEDHFNGCVR